MSMKYPYRDLGVPFDRNFRNDLNANFDDIEHDIRMIGGEAAQQALEAAYEAETQAIYAQTSGDYAQDKGDYAAQQGDYAKTQGDYAKAQGDAARDAVNNANNALAAANEAVNNANTAIENANIAITNANNAAASANDAATNANSAATNANNAADNANTQATNAQNAAQAANDAAQAANQAAANANEAADNANTAAQDIINNMRYIEPYNPNTTYHKNNVVSYNGSSFIAKQTTTGNTPIGDANDPYWGLLAQRGVDGQGAANSVNGILPDVNGNIVLTASDIGAETPAGAQAKADQAETNVKNYFDSQKGQPNGVATLGPDGKVPTEQLSSDAATKDELTHLNINVIDMAVELETLKGATLNGVTANIFIETFQNLNDINLMNGVYDSTNKRLVL